MSKIIKKYQCSKAFVCKKTYEKYFAEIASRKKLCIFGAGALGKTTAKWLLDNGIHPSYVTDNNPHFDRGGGIQN